MKTPAAVSRRQALAAKKAWRTRRAAAKAARRAAVSRRQARAAVKAWETRRTVATLVAMMGGVK